MTSLLEKVMLAIGPLCLALESLMDITFTDNTCLTCIFRSREIGTSITDETSDYDVNHKIWIFLGHFKGKIVKMAVMMKCVTQVSFTRATRWVPLYLSKNT